MNEQIRLLKGDCLELMKDIPDKSIDAIICDLPYGTTACKWDAVIPFEPLWEQYERIIKDNGAIVLTASQPFTTMLINSNIKLFKYCWVWEKEQGVNFLMAKKQPLKVHEDICVFYKKQCTYNPQMTMGKPYISGKGDSGEVTGRVKKVQTKNNGTRYPRSVIQFKRETGLHPTQKPVELCEYLIKTYTNEGELVLDNAMGSGTTGIACLNTNRRFIGIEKDDKYFEIASNRIKNHINKDLQEKMNTEQNFNSALHPAIAAMQCYAQPSIQLFNCDNRILMQTLADESIDVICIDPPYLYLKNQKLERVFDEQKFFEECKRLLTKNGFIVMFGRGTSFYRWNTILYNLGFTFKEEIVWDKSYCTSPLMAISRVHETISIFTKGKGTINKVKVPYLEMKGHDLDAIITDIKRLKTTFKNTKSLDAVLAFLENKKIERVDYGKGGVTHNGVMKPDRCVSVIDCIEGGLKEKSIVNIYDYNSKDRVHNYKYNVVASPKLKNGDRCVYVVSNIIDGQNEKSIIKQVRDHYNTIHPTQKPVRLLERLLALVIPKDKEPKEIVVADFFGGSFSTMEAVYNMGMQGIACEIDKEYFEAGKKRIESLPPR